MDFIPRALFAAALCLVLAAPAAVYAEAFEKIALGNGHTCGVTAGGGLKCWGLNQSGQLGDGSTNDSSVPVDVIGLSAGVVSVAAGDGHTCALTSGGAVKCWGKNVSGQLGNGTNSRSSSPVDVAGLSSGVAALAAGGPHSCAALAAGEVRCWGSNTFGELGIGSTAPGSSNVPLAVTGLTGDISRLTLGWAHSCVLLSGGAVKCWGWNAYGQLGDGTMVQREAPTAITGLAGAALVVAAGDWHTCAVTAGGGVKCWGANGGRLGGGSGNSSAPIAVSGLSAGVSAAACGSWHSCALTLQGGLKCWGMNAAGELGNGTTGDSSIPVNVTGLSHDVTGVALGNSHSCAVTSWKAVMCWGDNDFGALGNAGTTDSSIPVAVFGSPPAPSPTATPAGGCTCSLKVNTACRGPGGTALRTRCRFTAVVRDQNLAGIQGAQVVIVRKYPGGGWSSVGSGISSSSGTYAKRARVFRTAVYRAAADQGACTSKTLRVRVRRP